MALKHTLKGVQVSDDGVLIQAYFVLHSESQASCFIVKVKSQKMEGLMGILLQQLGEFFLPWIYHSTDISKQFKMLLKKSKLFVNLYQALLKHY